MSTKTVCAIVGIFLGLSLAVDGVRAQTGAAQSADAGQAPKMAEEVYKNIQVLKGVPADLVFPIMEVFEDSLTVNCFHCHAMGSGNEVDTKPQKLLARMMMKMVLSLNKDHFGGRVATSCYTCHRGTVIPVGGVVIVEDDPLHAHPPAGAAGATQAPPAGAAGAAQAPPAGAAGATQPQLPAAAQLLDKYIQATGGMEALSKITSRAAKGHFVDPNGRRFPAELYLQGPDKRITLWRLEKTEDADAYNGDVGWMVREGRLRYMSAPDVEGTKLENDIYLATHVKQLYDQWKVGPPEKVGDRNASVLDGTAKGRVPIRLYLDQETGMLLRFLHFTITPFGTLPTQVDYGDYRTVDGVQVPFRSRTWRSGPGYLWSTIELEQVEQNVSVDDAKFAKPTRPPASGQVVLVR